jgi:hypothetical protein
MPISSMRNRFSLVYLIPVPCAVVIAKNIAPDDVDPVESILRTVKVNLFTRFFCYEGRATIHGSADCHQHRPELGCSINVQGSQESSWILPPLQDDNSQYCVSVQHGVSKDDCMAITLENSPPINIQQPSHADFTNVRDSVAFALESSLEGRTPRYPDPPAKSKTN